MVVLIGAEEAAVSVGCAGALLAAAGVVEAVVGANVLDLGTTDGLAFFDFAAGGGVGAAATVLRNDVPDGVPVLLSGTNFGDARTLPPTGADAGTADDAGGAERADRAERVERMDALLIGRSVLVLLLVFCCGARAEGGLGARLRRRSLGLRSSVRSPRSVLARTVPANATALAISLAEGGTNEGDTGLMVGAVVGPE